MKKENEKNNQIFIEWIIISIILMISFIQYGKKLQLPDNNQQEKLGWTITITILLCIYITEKTIPNIQERRLINSVIIFAGTFSYLYYLKGTNTLI